MKIICASSLALGREIFSTLGEVTVVPERDITAEVVRDADALIVRSKVRVNRELLEGSRVSFVGTATAGTDHFDVPWLEEHGLAWTSAPGSNARSVAEYVVAALLRLAVRHPVSLEGKRLAIVGVGNVGRRLADLAPALGLEVLLNDPPRAAVESDPALRSLEEILPQADIVSLHVPLTLEGPYATRHLVDCRFLSLLKPGCLFVNASRGEVVDEDSLLLALRQGWVSRSVLDVFEREPRLRCEVAIQADLISPHIAGYSYEGRVNGTHLCYEAACRFFEREATWRASPADCPSCPAIQLDARGRRVEEVLDAVVRVAYDIEADDAALRSGLVEDDVERGRHFQKLRAQYPNRYEFGAWPVAVRGADDVVRERLRALGFQTAGYT
jgi:erythronate-4-phosphate dehydrogenase